MAMIISKLNEKLARYSQCECSNKECGALLSEHTVAMGGGIQCRKHAKYSVDGRLLCTDCMRFRRLPTEGER